MYEVWAYWWLIFPVGGFAFAAFERWLSYKRSHDHLELLKAYAAKGLEPPAELVRAASETIDDAEADEDAVDPSRRVVRRLRRLRRLRRYGSYREWRTAIVTGSVALGFWVSSIFAYLPGTEGPFRVVAIILTCVSAANLLFAFMSKRFRD